MDSIVRPAIEEYCTAHSAAPSALLAEVHAYTIRNCASAQMLIGPLEAAFLQLLVRATNVRRILEIGTFTGYSALAMAEALPPNGEIITCDIDPQHADIAQRFFARSPHGHKITLRLGPALDTLRRLPADLPYDLVFIDADKENYLAYYEQALPLVKTSGLIVADNVLWYGRVLHPEEKSDGVGDKTSEATRAIVKFNAHVRDDTRVECVMLPLRDGVSLIRKR
jgi:caffeoyl-CoA O-methyltransferase